MAKIDAVHSKILEEIKRLENSIKDDQIRLSTLKGLLPNKGNKVDEKPPGFVLTREIEKVFNENKEHYLTTDAIVSGIEKNWNGYTPRKNSVEATISTWKSQNKVQKNDEGGYIYNFG